MNHLPEFSAILPVGLIREAFHLSLTSGTRGSTLQPGAELFVAVTESGKRFRGSPTAAVKVLDLPESGSYPANTSTLGRFAVIDGHGQPVVRNLATGEHANYPLSVSALHVSEGGLVQKGDPICELCDASGQTVRMRSPEAGRILRLGFSGKDTIPQRSEFFSLQTDRLEVPETEAVKLFSWNISSDIEPEPGKEKSATARRQPHEVETPKEPGEPPKPREKEPTPWIIRIWSFLFFGAMAFVLAGLLFGERISSGIELVSQTYQRIVSKEETSVPSTATADHDLMSTTGSVPEAKGETNSARQSTTKPEKNTEDVLEVARRKIERARAELDSPDSAVKEATKPVDDLLYGDWEATQEDTRIHFGGQDGTISLKGDDPIYIGIIGPHWAPSARRWEVMVYNDHRDLNLHLEIAELSESILVLRPVDTRDYWFYTRVKD